MLYAIIAEDAPGTSAQRLATREQHLERLRALQDDARLVLAGPCPAIDNVDPGPAGFTGSIIIAEFDSIADAQVWAEADPYRSAGVYANVLIKPFKQVFPD